MATNTTNRNLQAALRLAEKGMAVFPCWPNKKNPVCKRGLKRIAKGVPAGTRNMSAASLCGYPLRKNIDPETTLNLILGWDLLCSPPQGPESIVATVESVLAKELRRRGRRYDLSAKE